MAKKKKETESLPREPKRQPGYFELYFGGKLVGTRLTTEDFLPKYFINLEKNLTKDIDTEELLSKYDNIWSTKGEVYYIDSWGHRWKDTKPSKDKLITYINEYSEKI